MGRAGLSAISVQSFSFSYFVLYHTELRLQFSQKKKSSGVNEEIGIWFHWQSYIVFPPFQIAVRLTFFTPSLTTRFIQFFVQNITFFCCGLFYQYKVSKNDLNLVIFA